MTMTAPAPASMQRDMEPPAAGDQPFLVTFTALVVEDHPLVRESVVGRLRSLGAVDIVEAASLAEARARARTGPRDLAVLDLSLPDGSGIELVSHLRAEGWPRVLVLSSADDPHSVRMAFAAGAQGYLLKSSSTAAVSRGVQQVLRGGIYADSTVASLMASSLRGEIGGEGGVNELSPREVEVIEHVAEGRSNKEIGTLLCLSSLTVKSHLARIARKLGTGDRAEIVAMAMRTGVIR